MDLARRCVQIAREIAAAVPVARIERLFLPQLRPDPPQSGEFGALVLVDGSVGLLFVLLDETLAELRERGVPAQLRGSDPVAIAERFASAEPLERAVGLAALNALGQCVLRRAGYLPPAPDSLAGIAPAPGDHIGMVGYFPPLVARLRGTGIPLTVIELKRELIGREDNVEVTDDPRRLRGCNKVLCTSTVMLNDSLDAILAQCTGASQIAVIGPGAGFLPDPLFERGVSAVGGNAVLDHQDFLRRVARDEPWGDSARKYCIYAADYPGYRALLQSPAAPA